MHVITLDVFIDSCFGYVIVVSDNHGVKTVYYDGWLSVIRRLPLTPWSIVKVKGH